MTQHSAASHRARNRKVEADQFQQALELETERHRDTERQLAEERTNLVLCRSTIKTMRAEVEDGRKLRADLISMLKRHGIEV